MVINLSESTSASLTTVSTIERSSGSMSLSTHAEKKSQVSMKFLNLSAVVGACLAVLCVPYTFARLLPKMIFPLFNFISNMQLKLIH